MHNSSARFSSRRLHDHSARLGCRWHTRWIAITLSASCAAALADDPIFGSGFEAECPGAAVGVIAGTGSSLLLRGTVVTPTVAFLGEVLVEGDTITCAAASCAGQTGASTASIIETRGLIFPGLIDASNAALFGAFDEDDWSPEQLYTNHVQWQSDARYGALVDAKKYLNGEGASPVELGCELDKYGELIAMLGGATSVVAKANPPDLACYGSLTRTIDQAPNDLGTDSIQVALLFPATPAADGVCSNLNSSQTDAYVINIAEGVDNVARNEFVQLGTITTIDGCLYAPQTVIVGGAALGEPELAIMGAQGMSLVWQPRSDVRLYGATANVPLALADSINVALSANGSINGSHDLLAALRYARAYSTAQWGAAVSDVELVQMVTTRAAKALALDTALGSIAVGKKADLTVVSANTCSAPWSALVNARKRDIRMVMIGGVALYGDVALQAAAPVTPGCEALNVCGVSKFVCVAESGGTVADKLGQTLAEITGGLTAGFQDYDALDLSPWNFSPLAPLATCP